ncbi:MAG: hypothetical protein WCF53_11630, partial [Pseudolabrys sp.]
RRIVGVWPFPGAGRSDQANPNVRFGSKVDICGAKRHVRFTPESGHSTLSWKRFSVQAEYRPLAHLAAIEHHPSRGKSIS